MVERPRQAVPFAVVKLSYIQVSKPVDSKTQSEGSRYLYLDIITIFSVLARISKGQGATSEKGTFKRKRWLKKGTLFLNCFYN